MARTKTCKIVPRKYVDENFGVALYIQQDKFGGAQITVKIIGVDKSAVFKFDKYGQELVNPILPLEAQAKFLGIEDVDTYSEAELQKEIRRRQKEALRE